MRENGTICPLGLFPPILFTLRANTGHFPLQTYVLECRKGHYGGTKTKGEFVLASRPQNSGNAAKQRKTKKTSITGIDLKLGRAECKAGEKKLKGQMVTLPALVFFFAQGFGIQ